MENPLPKLMAGYEERQWRNDPERWAEAVREYPLKLARLVVEDTCRRVEESRGQFPWNFYRGDFHAHSDHSDGRGTVAQIAEMVAAAGLDFQYVTDHWGITQAQECREHGLWVGQEPVTALHHMGILGLDHAFTPAMDFLADMAEAKRRGAVVFVPHPTGWWATRVYNEEQTAILDELPAPFLMEICNGANNLVSAFDYTDESAIRLWDHLLGLGRVVHALGNTDAHTPMAIGMVWNSVYASTLSEASVLEAVTAGHSFVSDGPLLHISLDEAVMGDRVLSPQGALQVCAVDVRGLSAVRVICDGERHFTQLLDGDARWEGQIALPPSANRYVRVEVRSQDGRRAYSNPIYLGEPVS